MATFQYGNRGPRTRPWRARAKRGRWYNLGYFATRAEAERAEAEFDEKFPPPPGARPRLASRP